MRFDHYVTCANGAATADPVADPGSVPASHVFQLAERDLRTGEKSNRVLLGLEAPTAENINLELYALDEADETATAANRHWYLVLTVVALGGGRVAQTRREQAGEAFVGGGTFYLRVTGEAISADRRVGIRATV